MTETRQFTSTPIGGEFGISVAFDTLQDVIDYEEGRIVPTHGYPRFVPHREVARREALARRSSGMPFAVAFPSKRQVCFVLNDFALRYQSARARFPLDDTTSELVNKMHPGRRNAIASGGRHALQLVELDGLHVVCMDDPEDYERLRALRRIWGSGFDVHSLAGVSVMRPGMASDPSLKQAVLKWEGRTAQGALFFQSGMAALSSLILMTMWLERRLILVGPAYVDTGIIASAWRREVPGLECDWLPADFDRAMLDDALERGPSLLLAEIPANPQLTLPDVPLILEATAEHDVVLALDATVATPYNFKGLDHRFDLVMHSTSKFLGGHYDHLGGVISGRSGALLRPLREVRDALDLGMCANQQAILAYNLRGFEARMRAINRNGEAVAEALGGWSGIDRVSYPGAQPGRQAELASGLLRPGRSGLVTFSLKEKGLEPLRRFYDAIQPPVLKGPGLGGETSLICPYVMLAHYRDSDAFLEAQGLDRHSLRLSVGTEPVDAIIEALGIGT